MSKRFISNCMLILTAMIWGFAFVAQKDASSYIGSFTFNGIRFMMGALSLIPVILIFERDGLKDKGKVIRTFKYGIITGIVLFCASALQQFGVVMITQASKAGFITGLYTVLVPVFGIFMGKRTSANTWIGAVLAVIGLYMVSVIGAPTVEFGDLLLLIGAVFWAFHIITIDKFVDKVNPIQYSSVQFFTCSAINLILMLIFELPSFSMANIMAAGISILYAGVMSSGIAYTLQVVGQKHSEPTQAAIIFSLESVFGCIGCMLILGDELSVISLVGCGLIFAGIVLSQLKFKKHTNYNI